jgi:hypothetical protein
VHVVVVIPRTAREAVDGGIAGEHVLGAGAGAAERRAAEEREVVLVGGEREVHVGDDAVVALPDILLDHCHRRGR